jgi:hypothetical protein
MTIAIVLLVAATGCLETCEESSIVVSAMTASDVDSSQNESVVRLGLEQDLITIFAQTNVIGVHGEDQFYGVGVSGALDVNDVALLGQPYFGYQVGVPTEDEDGGFHGPLLGTRYKLSDNVETVVEGWYRSFNGPLKAMDYVDEWKALVGIRYKF